MSNSNRLNIMSWNVLSSKAFRHTLNAKRYIGKLDKKKGDINETRKARDSRHYIIIKKIIENDCDLILLQELDGFLSINNYHAGFAAVAEYPALTVPMGYQDNGKPMGLTFISCRLRERQLLEWAYVYEQVSKARVAPKDYN